MLTYSKAKYRLTEDADNWYIEYIHPEVEFKLKVKVSNLISRFANLTGFPEGKITGGARDHEYCMARQSLIYFLKKNTALTLKGTGKFFTSRDHSTVLHALQTIENYLSTPNGGTECDQVQDYLNILKELWENS